MAQVFPQKQSKKKFRFFLACVFIVLLIEPVFPSKAANLDRSFRKTKVQHFLPRHGRTIARKLAQKIMSQEFFRKQELPVQAALASIQVDVEGQVTDKIFTDQILNAFLDYRGLMIVNQDPSLDLKTAYKLVSYDHSWLTRKRGLLMGAVYYLSGSIQEVIEPDERGKIYKMYKTEIFLKDSQTDEPILKQTIYSYKKQVKDPLKNTTRRGPVSVGYFLSASERIIPLPSLP